MVDKEEAIKRLVKAYPGYRDQFEVEISSYIGLGGEFLWSMIISSPLINLVVKNLGEGNYDRADELFLEIEKLIAGGTQEVVNIICTGFLEGMQNQTDLPSKYWAPLLGTRATSFCKSMDDFYGCKTEGLACYSA